MTIHKAFKMRIYPSQEQETLILKTIGSCRFIYNQMLAERIEVYEKLKDNKRELYEHKYKTEKMYKEEFEWLKEVDSIALQQANNDLSCAYQNFFKSLKGQRKGEKIGYPKFKKKGQKDSYRTSNNNYKTGEGNLRIDFLSHKIKLPKLGWIQFRDGRDSFEGIIKSATVSRSSSGKYFVSVLFEQEIEDREIKTESVIGLDMSLSSFYVDQDGNSPAYERIYRNNEKRLSRLQRRVSKKKQGSNNRKKAQMRVNVLHEKIANSRKDFTQKLSTSLVEKFDVIVVENLNLKAMAQCLKLGKSINDLGFGMFLNQLKYKALWNGKTVIEADKWFASSKTCSKCGLVHKKLSLKDRIFNCPSCGFEINRDQNAGINLKKYGLKKIGLLQSDVKPVEIKSSIQMISFGQDLSMKQEILNVNLG